MDFIKLNNKIVIERLLSTQAKNTLKMQCTDCSNESIYTAFFGWLLCGACWRKAMGLDRRQTYTKA